MNEIIKAPEGYKYEVVDETTVRLVKDEERLVPAELVEFTFVYPYLRNKDKYIKFDGECISQSHSQYWEDKPTAKLLNCNFEDLKKGDIFRYSVGNFGNEDEQEDLGLMCIYLIENDIIYAKYYSVVYKEFQCSRIIKNLSLIFQKVVKR